MNKIILAVLAVTLASPLVAQEHNKKFDKKHPRRAEVLKRTDHQKGRADRLEKQGKLTKGQERQIDRQDNRIRREEQRDARKNGGMITKGEKARMNRQENRVNREMKRDESKDAANGSAPATPPTSGQ